MERDQLQQLLQQEIVHLQNPVLLQEAITFVRQLKARDATPSSNGLHEGLNAQNASSNETMSREEFLRKLRGM